MPGLPSSKAMMPTLRRTPAIRYASLASSSGAGHAAQTSQAPQGERVTADGGDLLAVTAACDILKRVI